MHTDAFHVTARVFSRTLFLSSSCECCKSCVCGWVRISIWSSSINLHNVFCGWDGDRKERVVEEGDTLEMRWGAAWRHGWRLVLMNGSLNWLQCPSRVFYFILFFASMKGHNKVCYICLKQVLFNPTSAVFNQVVCTFVLSDSINTLLSSCSLPSPHTALISWLFPKSLFPSSTGFSPCTAHVSRILFTSPQIPFPLIILNSL